MFGKGVCILLCASKKAELIDMKKKIQSTFCKYEVVPCILRLPSGQVVWAPAQTDEPGLHFPLSSERVRLLQRVSGLPRGIFPDGCAQIYLEDFQPDAPPASFGSWMTELIIVCLRECPDILQMKQLGCVILFFWSQQVSTACNHG